ncbi:hypothetical protein J6P92_06325 [bacterium]|nr:hypothetical protein [bacterium]
MGMSASQARLLSITARMSNNENTGQGISYAKQRLADQTQQITNEYNEALDTTKLTVLTGFNGAEANYEDISYNRMTCLQMAETTKQYVVTDTKGRVLVTEQIADAYTLSKGDYNRFLAKLGYSQADLYVQKNYSAYSDEEKQKLELEKRAARVQIHEAWDKYFETVGITVDDDEHDIYTEEAYAQDNDIEKYKWTNTYASVVIDNDLTFIDENENPISSSDVATRGYSFIGDGYASYRTAKKDESGETVYKKDEDGEYYVDKNGEKIEPDEYSDDVKNNPDYEKRYYDKTGAEIPKDAYSEENQNRRVKNDDGTFKQDTAGNYLDADDKIIEKDAYSSSVRNNTSYTYKYVEKATGKEVPKDSYSEASKKKMVPEDYIWEPISFDGTTKESKDLFDYAMALTEAYYRTESPMNGIEGEIFDLDAYKTAANSDNANALKYYKNLFNRIQQNGMFTYTDSAEKCSKYEGYEYSQLTVGTGKVAKNPLKDNHTFEAALRDGSLRLEYYSTTERKFKSTTLSEDNCIQEVIDERAVAKAESKYNQDMADLEHKDKQLDLELKKLDTEHNALQTEYESVKNVVDKNVESTFKTFS